MFEELMKWTAAKSRTASTGRCSTCCSIAVTSSVNCGSSARWMTVTSSDHCSIGMTLDLRESSRVPAAGGNDNGGGAARGRSDDFRFWIADFGLKCGRAAPVPSIQNPESAIQKDLDQLVREHFRSRAVQVAQHGFAAALVEADAHQR